MRVQPMCNATIVNSITSIVTSVAPYRPPVTCRRAFFVLSKVRFFVVVFVVVVVAMIELLTLFVLVRL
jgi:hypothetical protein